jgi:hypothetical protein
MKAKIHIILIAILFTCADIKAQYVQPLTLQQKVDSATIIFEGKLVLRKTVNSRWGLCTDNYVLVSREFKGAFSTDTIEIVTLGGRNNETATAFSDAFTLGIHEGIFFCVPAPKGYVDVGNRQTYDVLNGKDGLISYYSKSYQDLKKDVYEPIEQLVGRLGVQLRITDLEQKAIDAKTNEERRQQGVINAIAKVIYYRFIAHKYIWDSTAAKPVLTSQFDATVTTNYSLKIYLGSVLYMVYDTSMFGLHPISEKKIVITPGNLNSKIYTLAASDSLPGMFKVAITTLLDTNNLAAFDTLASRPLDKTIIFHGKAYLPAGATYCRMYPAISRMEDHGRYFDLEKRKVLEFTKVMHHADPGFELNK